jgi:hypothetical protein
MTGSDDAAGLPRFPHAMASRLLFWMKGGFQALEFGNNVLGPFDRKLIADGPLNLAIPSDQDIDFSALFAHARFRPEGACSAGQPPCQSG